MLLCVIYKLQLIKCKIQLETLRKTFQNVHKTKLLPLIDKFCEFEIKLF